MSTRRRTRGLIAVAPITAALLVGAAVAPSAQAACSKPVFADPNSVVSCAAISAQQRFVVPRGVRRVRVIAAGAAGGNGSASVLCELFVRKPCQPFGFGGAGGTGAIASADLRVRPRQRLYVLVGGRGSTQQGPAGGAGGFNGGANGGRLRPENGISNYLSGGGGGGGGASDVRTCSIFAPSCNTLASRLIVAGGGGGGGGDVSFADSFGGVGGSGGAAVSDSSDGTAPDGGTGGVGGFGGTRTAGGSAGGAAATAGSLGAGGGGAGFADVTGPGGGGGGGGGLYGGGGATAGVDWMTAGAGGGGGSSFGPSGTRFAPASTPQDGSVRIVYLNTRVARRRAAK